MASGYGERAYGIGSLGFYGAGMMSICKRSRYALSIGTAALVAGCGGMQPRLADPLATPLGGALRHTNLLYVTDIGNGKIYVYSYPQGRILQQLTYGFSQSPTGDCIDDRGNVFVTGYNGHDVLVYTHGAKVPYLVLKDPGYPSGCAIDPTTQALAVANTFNQNAGKGNVAIWTDPLSTGSGGPVVYTGLPFIEPEWCAYDDNGNLFVDGEDYSKRESSLAELPKAAKSFETISLGTSLSFPAGDVQWDGQYISIAVASAVYQFSFSGSTGYVVGKTNLPSYWTLAAYTIAGVHAQHRKLLGTFSGSIGLFKYPSGKGPEKKISQNYPLAPVISPAQR